MGLNEQNRSAEWKDCWFMTYIRLLESIEKLEVLLVETLFSFGKLRQTWQNSTHFQKRTTTSVTLFVSSPLRNSPSCSAIVPSVAMCFAPNSSEELMARSKPPSRVATRSAVLEVAWSLSHPLCQQVIRCIISIDVYIYIY